MPFGCLGHNSDTVRGFDVLSRVLSSSQEDGSDDVGSMCIEPADASSHGRTDIILRGVESNKIVHSTLEDVLDNLSRNDVLSNYALPTTVNPIDRSRFLVGTIVS